MSESKKASGVLPRDAVQRSEAATPSAAGVPIASRKDVTLLRRLLDGDERAFTELVEHYHQGLLRLATLYVVDRPAAEEVVQETWLAVLQGLRSFEGKSTLKTWIFRILVNRAKTRGVREARLVPFSRLTAGEAEPAVGPEHFTTDGMWANPPQHWAEGSPEELLLRSEIAGLLEEAIAALPANQRAVITLRDVEGMESSEVCNVLELSETNQRVLLHRARAKMRRALEEYHREK